MPKPLKYPFDMLSAEKAFIFLRPEDGDRAHIAPCAYSYGRRHGFHVSCTKEEDGLRITRGKDIKPAQSED